MPLYAIEDSEQVHEEFLALDDDDAIARAYAWSVEHASDCILREFDCEAGEWFTIGRPSCGSALLQALASEVYYGLNLAMTIGDLPRSDRLVLARLIAKAKRAQLTLGPPNTNRPPAVDW